MNPQLNRRKLGLLLGGGAFGWGLPAVAADELPLFDAHIHYSHDAWELVPPKQAVAILRKAGLKGALVSASNDQGTQMLIAEAPDLIVAELRPYRTRGEIGSWVRDPTVVTYIEERLAKYTYFGIGEFHLSGGDAQLTVPKRMVALARERNLEKVREALRRHPRLWSDLAYRGDQATLGKVDPAWRDAFNEFPDRFMVGTDTFSPERWHYIGSHADYSRAWLADLPKPLAEQIAWRNAERLLRGGATGKA